MQKSAFIIQAVLGFLFIMGILMTVVPHQVDRAQKGVYRALRLISAKTAAMQITRREVIIQRCMGVCYVLGCLLLLFNMRLHIGKLPSQEGSPSVRSSPPLHRTVQEIVQPMLSRYVGLVVAVIADENQDISGLGRIHLASNQPPDGHTIFEIGSVSKVFTGILLAEMVDKRQITLDATLSSLLPSGALPPDSQANRITVGHLTTHTSGLPRMPAHTFHPSKIWQSISAGDSYRDYTEGDMLATIPRKKARYAPGEHFSYSNAGVGLLGMILSKQSGMAYHDMIKTTIANPLGLKDTGVLLNKEQHSRLAPGYRSYLHIGPYYLAQRAENWNFPNCIAGAGSIRSTGADMLVFLAANMGRNVSNVTPAWQHAHQILFTQHNIRIGMGWFHDPLPQSGEPVIWHNGGTGGYASFLGFTENGRFGVVVLSNSAQKVDHIGYRILETLVSEW